MCVIITYQNKCFKNTNIKISHSHVYVKQTCLLNPEIERKLFYLFLVEFIFGIPTESQKCSETMNQLIIQAVLTVETKVRRGN